MARRRASRGLLLVLAMALAHGAGARPIESESMTATMTATSSMTPSMTATMTASSSVGWASSSGSSSASASASASQTASPSASLSFLASPSLTATRSPSLSGSPSLTATRSSTTSITSTLSRGASPSATNTASPSTTRTSAATRSVTPTVLPPRPVEVILSLLGGKRGTLRSGELAAELRRALANLTQLDPNFVRYKSLTFTNSTGGSSTQAVTANDPLNGQTAWTATPSRSPGPTGSPAGTPSNTPSSSGSPSGSPSASASGSASASESPAGAPVVRRLAPLHPERRALVAAEDDACSDAPPASVNDAGTTDVTLEIVIPDTYDPATSAAVAALIQGALGQPEPFEAFAQSWLNCTKALGLIDESTDILALVQQLILAPPVVNLLAPSPYPTPSPLGGAPSSPPVASDEGYKLSQGARIAIGLGIFGVLVMVAAAVMVARQQAAAGATAAAAGASAGSAPDLSEIAQPATHAVTGASSAPAIV